MIHKFLFLYSVYLSHAVSSTSRRDYWIRQCNLCQLQTFLFFSRFCAEVDEFLSPILLIYILMYEFMICVPLYQLVLVIKKPTIFTAIPNRHTTQFAHFPLTPWSRIPLHEPLSSIVKNSYPTVVTTPTELSLSYCLIFRNIITG